MSVEEEAATYAAATIRELVAELAGAVVGQDATAEKRIEEAIRTAVLIGAALQAMADPPSVLIAASRAVLVVARHLRTDPAPPPPRRCLCDGAGKLVQFDEDVPEVAFRVGLTDPKVKLVQCPHCNGTGQQLCGCTTLDVRCPSRREPS